MTVRDDGRDLAALQLRNEDYGRKHVLGVYKWRSLNQPWWAFWRPTHALEYVGRVLLEKF